VTIKVSINNSPFTSFIPYSRNCIAWVRAIQATVLDLERTFQLAYVPDLEIQVIHARLFLLKPQETKIARR
jgi:hypothetical protein